MHDPQLDAQPTRRRLLALGLGVGASAALSGRALAEDAARPLVVYAVRHAEKGEGRDPGLTEAGAARAAELQRVLKDVAFDAVYSTNTLRTRSTAQPVAEGHGLEVTTYDPGGIAKQLKAGEARTVLVVGHSNTTPDLIRALGGDFELKLLPESCYDALLLAVVLPGGGTLVQHLHFGAESK